jgi:hypothetical protein
MKLNQIVPSPKRSGRSRSAGRPLLGETEDSFLADVTIATAHGQLKTGSASRSERIARTTAHSLMLLNLRETATTLATLAALALHQ